MKRFECNSAESLSGIVSCQWTPVSSDSLTHSNSWKFTTLVLLSGFPRPFWFGNAFSSVRENALQELISGSSDVARSPQQSSCRSDLPPKKNCKVHHWKGKTGPVVTTTALHRGLQNVLWLWPLLRAELSSLRLPCVAYSWSSHSGLFPPCYPHRSHPAVREKTGSAHQKNGIWLISIPQRALLWEPDAKVGWHGGHWRSVSYRFICKQANTSSGVNKPMESWGACSGVKSNKFRKLFLAEKGNWQRAAAASYVTLYI